MAYELWDAETGNILGAFETEDEAIDMVREAVQAYGTGYAETLFLGYEDDRGRSQMVADSSTLIARATSSQRRLAGSTPETRSSRTKMAG